MSHDIRPIAEPDIESFRETLDAVAREQSFLAFLEAPPLDRVGTLSSKISSADIHSSSLLSIEGRYENSLSMALVTGR
jgi:hypothetical protein